MRPLVPHTVQDTRRAARAVRGLLRGLLDDASADDVMQETWVRALESPPRRDVNHDGWLRTVARNLALNLHRSRARRRAREHAAAEEGVSVSSAA